jgi:hypothetical protein
MRLPVCVCVLLVTTVTPAFPSRARGGDTEVTVSGTVTDQSGKPVAGARVGAIIDGKLQSINDDSKDGTGADGKYKGTIKVPAGQDTNVKITAKTVGDPKKSASGTKVTVPRDIGSTTVTVKKGDTTATGNVKLGKPDSFTRTDTTKGPLPLDHTCLYTDPTYLYNAATGKLSFTNAFFPNVPQMFVAGLVMYENGTMATGNKLDLMGNPITESIFGQPFELSPITRTGSLGNETFFSDGHVSIHDANGDTLLNADVVHIVAQTDPSNPGMSGELSNVTFGSPGLGSRTIDEWAGTAKDGGDLRFFFDNALISDTNGFTNDTTFSSMVEISSTTTPEPSTLALLAAGTLGLLGYGWRRRKQSRTSDHSKE